METYVRYHKERKVQEAPMTMSCSPFASYVGGSLRLLKVPDLDPITKAFQNDFGYDAKPFMEMVEACRNLCGTVISLRPKRCSRLTFCSEVSAEVRVCDFSRGFTLQDSDVMCIMGEVTLHFHKATEEFIRLPSRRLVLTIAPFCKKGIAPRVKGNSAYVKRRYERRPNMNHIIQKDVTTLECCILCQDRDKRRSLFYMEAQSRNVKDELQLHFMVRVPMAAEKDNPKKKAGVA